MVVTTGRVSPLDPQRPQKVIRVSSFWVPYTWINMCNWLRSTYCLLSTCLFPGFTPVAHTANMIGSRAESQLHIHSINKCNDPNLAFADYLPMIVWPANYICLANYRYILFCSIDCFWFMSHSKYQKTLISLMEWFSIVRLTWHLFLSYLSGSHLIKQSVHECDFADTDSHTVKGF